MSKIEEGSVKNLVSNDDQKIIAVGTETDINNIKKEDKLDFDQFKQLYTHLIDSKCIADYGSIEDEDLWEDAAKDLFLQTKMYIPSEENKPDKEPLETRKVEESKELTEGAINWDYGVDSFAYFDSTNNKSHLPVPKDISNCSVGDEIHLNGDTFKKIADNKWEKHSRQDHVLSGDKTDDDIQQIVDSTYLHYNDEPEYIKKARERLSETKITKEDTIKNLNVTEFVELVDKLKAMDLWDGKDETFKDAVEKYYSILDTQSKLKNEGTILSEEQLKEEADSPQFKYQLLDRLKSDCDYFLGNGNRYEKHLWAGNVDDQIAKMKELYNKLPEKPEWLTMEDIENYEKEMKQDVKTESRDRVAENLPKFVYDLTKSDFDKYGETAWSVNGPMKNVNGRTVYEVYRNGKSDFKIADVVAEIQKEFPELKLSLQSTAPGDRVFFVKETKKQESQSTVEENVKWHGKTFTESKVTDYIPEEELDSLIKNNKILKVAKSYKILEDDIIEITTDTGKSYYKVIKGDDPNTYEAYWVDKSGKKLGDAFILKETKNIKTETRDKVVEEGAKEDLGIEPGSDEEAEGTLTESVNIGDKVKILNSNELHNNKQGEVTYIDDDIITVKLDNGRSFNYDKNQVQKIEEGVEEKTTLEEDKFFNLYQSFNNLYGINKMNPSELIEFINDLKKMNRISDKDFNVMNDYANKWQDLINKTGYESNIVNESKEVKTEYQYEMERRRGRPNLDKIAKEIFEYDDYYIDIVNNYKDEWEFVKDNIAEVAAEYNLKEQAAEAVMRKIYSMAKQHSKEVNGND